MNYSIDKPKELLGKDYCYDSFSNNEVLLGKKKGNMPKSYRCTKPS